MMLRLCIGNCLDLIKLGFRTDFKVFAKLSDIPPRRGQVFLKTLKTQVKIILNFARTHCDYLLVTQRVKIDLIVHKRSGLQSGALRSHCV